MGYYTHHTLTWTQQDDSDRSVPQCEHQIPEDAAFCPTCGRQVKSAPVSDAIQRFMEANEDAYYGILSDGEPAKWYEHEQPMRALSQHFPFHLFTLHGEGEEAGDLWNEYYLDGEMQLAKAQIVYGAFDAGALK